MATISKTMVVIHWTWSVVTLNSRIRVGKATFKAVARAIDMAVALDERNKGVPSTKGVL